MMMNFMGIIVSYIYFFGLLLLAPIFKKNPEMSRKFVHIMLGNWWFMVLFFFSNVFAAAFVPFTFIFINYFSIKRNNARGLLSELERKGAQKSHGIVIYPVAMVLLVVLSFAVFKEPYIGGLGLLALAYGDGFAALIGKKYRYAPFRIWGNEKTLAGCVGMFIATFLSITVYLVLTNNIFFSLPLFLFIIALVALVAALFEAFTPAGMDNITVPLSAVGTYWLLTQVVSVSIVTP